MASFNILHGVLADGSGRVDNDELVRSCASLDADVLALQEVDAGVPRSGRVDQATFVADRLGMAVVFGKTARVGLIGKFGNALLVRGAITDVEVRSLTRTSRRHTPCGMVLATATVDDEPPLIVAVAHLSIRRPEVHQQLEQVLATLIARAAGRPCVLLGDLNLRAAEVEAAVEASGLALADPTLPTFPRAAPRSRIDHIAVGGGLETGPVEVVATETSDHCALVASVLGASVHL